MPSFFPQNKVSVPNTQPTGGIIGNMVSSMIANSELGDTVKRFVSLFERIDQRLAAIETKLDTLTERNARDG